MVTARLRSLERVEKVVSQIGAARSGMTGRGLVESVDLLNANAVVLMYGRGGQTAKCWQPAKMAQCETREIRGRIGVS